MCAENFESLKVAIKRMHIYHSSSCSISTAELNGEVLYSGIVKDSLDSLSKRVPRMSESIYLPSRIKMIDSQHLPPASRVWMTIDEGSTIETTFDLTQIIDQDDFTSTTTGEKRDLKGHQVRYIPLPTSACLKLMDLLRYLDRNLLEHVACLADGAGGFTRVLAMTPYVKSVFYNTLVLQGSSVPQMRPIPYVPLLCDLPSELQSKVEGLDATNDLCSDITDMSFPSIVQTWVREEFPTVVGDAESPVYYGALAAIRLAQGYLRCAAEWRCQQALYLDSWGTWWDRHLVGRPCWRSLSSLYKVKDDITGAAWW